ncbi:MAG: transcription-repair coupling factor [Bacteroidales bacterium]|nr:transcription-repair coupling factor [Bacteroidales bacterium]
METSLTELYSLHPNHGALEKILKTSDKIFVKGLNTSAFSFFAASDKILASKPLIVVMNNDEEAAYTYNDFQVSEKKREVFYYPFSHKHSVLKTGEENEVSTESLLSKTEVLDKISKLSNYVLITYPEALAENVISAKELENNTLTLSKGEKVSTDFITEVLDTYGFQLVDFVAEPGQYSLRGSIIDIYSYSNDEPYRIDFFGDEIDSIRTFDVVNQLSINKVDTITIIPDICRKESEFEKIPFLDFIAKNCVLWFDDLSFTQQQIKNFSLKNSVNDDGKDDDPDKPHFVEAEVFEKSLENKIVINSGLIVDKKDENNTLTFNILAQPVFKKNFEMLSENIYNYQSLGYKVFIAVLNDRQTVRLNDIFHSEAVKKHVTFEAFIAGVNQGFIDNDLKLCCYTDHQIFERYLKYRLKEIRIKRNRDALTISEMNTLKPGDYVVHQDHGIGTFGGLETQEIGGKPHEVIRLVYKDNDILYVSIHALHKISKYKAGDGEPPKIYKLGSNTWNRLKQKTKAKVKDIASKLIKLYAQRKHEKGFAFSPDSYLQQALEASFIYEDTPDQEKATAAVKADMEKPEPMDRLICGDVGFGKTEIAVRAAFKAATDGKQVAVLVPTTILALQHYRTFSERLKDLPCTVEYVSRLRTYKEVKDILKRLEEGKIDIIIGTHKIVGKDIKFKDLGLLIIDEEQKFGVSVKEKLKQIKLNVDTLTLSATPIPRTLQFSLLGARDLSIINTPPPNRYPVVTEVHTFNENIIKEALEYEMGRHGQVFVIQNKIKEIYKTEALIKKLCPKAVCLTGHGQMDGNILEDIMLSFINNEADVLISTTIIENGLDISNANTIIVLDAQNFGLSELHQLRGRVGRSNKKAFCYLIAPPEENLTPQARQRLKAIENFSELGSGFNIAMQDLDIRGAGNLLGGEQSGFITEIGIETYQKILDEALEEIKEEEMKTLGTQEINPDDLKYVSDCSIDTDMEVLLPDNYVENVAERVKIYRQLDNVKDEDELQQTASRLEDRFGKIPKQTRDLFNIVRIRWVAIKLGIERISMKGGKMLCYFVSENSSPYFQSQIFGNILLYLQKHQKNTQMKQVGGKACIVVNSIDNTQKALDFLRGVFSNE